ncbi:MAG: hypothetical protein R3247_16595, partial [Rhodothermales bacterium]|nr:hypothetical protein [Rhodothermales bacterium]
MKTATPLFVLASLVLLLWAVPAHAQTCQGTTPCPDGSLSIILETTTVNPDGSKTYVWKVTADCNKALSHIAFELAD